MKVLKIYSDSFKNLSTETWMLSIVMLINRSGSMVLPFLGIYMTDELHFSIINTGIVLSFYGIGSVIGSWLGGYFTDKFGEYHVQVLSLFISVPLFLIIPLFPTVTGMATIILIQSIVSECFRPANSVAISKYAKSDNLTRAFSLNRMAVNLGYSFGPAMGGILSAISYEFLFIFNAAGALIAGIFYLKFFKRRHRIHVYKTQKLARQNRDQPQLKAKNAYLDFTFVWFTVFCGLFALCFFQFFNTIPIFYKEVAHLSQQTIGYVLGFSGFIIAVFEMLIVTLAERHLQLKQTLLLGSLTVAISYLMLIFDYSLLTIVVSISILSLSEILMLPFMSTITALRSGENNKGAYMGLNGMAFSVSFIFTPILGTYVAEDFGFNQLWLISAIILLFAGIALYFSVQKMFPNKKE